MGAASVIGPVELGIDPAGSEDFFTKTYAEAFAGIVDQDGPFELLFDTANSDIPSYIAKAASM